MIKIRFLASVLIISCILTGCRSSQVREIDAKIANLGTITKDSGEQIIGLEEMIDNLSEKERQDLNNYGKLVEARNEYDNIMLNALENDMIFNMAKKTVIQSMDQYNPKIHLIRDEKVVQIDMIANKDITDLLMYNSSVASPSWNLAVNNLKTLVGEFYGLIEEYNVDVVLYLKSDSVAGNLLEIKNDKIIFNVMD